MATPAERRRALERAIAQIRRDMLRNQRDAIASLERLLRDAQGIVVGQVGASGEITLAALPIILRNISPALDRLKQAMTDLMQDRQRQIFRAGQLMAEEPLARAGIAIDFGFQSTTLLDTAHDFSADLVTDITDELRRRINSEVRFAALGNKPPFEVMRTLSRSIKKKGPFRSAFHRAETITRTETGRLFSQSSQARMEQARRTVPTLQKQWIHGHVDRFPRTGHQAAHGQVRDIDEPFDVAPKIGMATEPLMFPRDPAASARNTVNCHCDHAPYLPTEAIAAIPEVA